MGRTKEIKTIGSVLEAARSKMNDEGKHWTKKAYHKTTSKGENKYCAVGAIDKVLMENYISPSSLDKYKLLNLLVTLINTKYNKRANQRGYCHVEEWNDSSLTKWEDVDSLFKEAAELYRKEKIKNL